MSVLLLTNPFAQSQTQPSQSAEITSAVSTAGQVISPAAVQPTTPSRSENTSGSATEFSGQGAGAGGDASRLPLILRDNQPQDATPSSVVNAQVAENKAGVGEDGEVLLPAPTPEMPDPIPTSPFLKRSAN